MKVPFLDVKQSYLSLKAQTDAAIERVLSGGVYIQGKEVELFEDTWASYCDAKFAIGVANGLDAIFLALLALNVGKGDEVIVPANTYIGTWLAVSRTGASIKPVPAHENTYNLNEELLCRAITRKTKAIIPVHLYGQPANLDPILDLARRKNIFVIEDAAQAHGAKYKNSVIGSKSDAVAWSFYPSKNLGAFGDAGAVTTNNEKLANNIRLFGNYGSIKKNQHKVLGYNSRLDPLQAAVLRLKLGFLDEWNLRRQKVAKFYLEELHSHNLILPKVPSWQESVWHIFAIRLKRRDELKKYLAENGVQTMIHYPTPPHEQAAYENISFRREDVELASLISNELLSLPMGPHLSDTGKNKVVDQNLLVV